MQFFTGSYTYTVDSKGRMNIPAGFRKQLTNGQGDSNVFITLNKIESFHYLCILTQEHFQNLSSEPALASGGPFKPDPKKMREFLEIMKEAQDCHYRRTGQADRSEEVSRKGRHPGTGYDRRRAGIHPALGSRCVRPVSRSRRFVERRFLQFMNGMRPSVERAAVSRSGAFE